MAATKQKAEKGSRGDRGQGAKMYHFISNFYLSLQSRLRLHCVQFNVFFFSMLERSQACFVNGTHLTCAPDTNSALKINTFPAVYDALAAF